MSPQDVAGYCAVLCGEAPNRASPQDHFWAHNPQLALFISAVSLQHSKSFKSYMDAVSSGRVAAVQGCLDEYQKVIRRAGDFHEDRRNSSP